MTKYRRKYELTFPFGEQIHTWICVGAKGGVHLHITDYGDEHEMKYGYRFSGGFECHYRYPPEYMGDKPPDHDMCHIINAPCWHDGTSSWVQDFWIPFWRSAPDDHIRMLEMIESEMKKRFEEIGLDALLNSIQSRED